MHIRLHELRNRGEQTLNFTVTVDLTDVSQVVEETPVSVKASARFRNELYIIEGKISGAVTLACSRCLKPIQWPFDLDWREILSERPVEEDEEEHIHYVTENEVDLTFFIREQLLLELPLAPVCAEDCRGFCPKCGVNLNETDCDCSHERIDPRLATLEQFFSDENKKGHL